MPPTTSYKKYIHDEDRVRYRNENKYRDSKGGTRRKRNRRRGRKSRRRPM